MYLHDFDKCVSIDALNLNVNKPSAGGKLSKNFSNFSLRFGNKNLEKFPTVKNFNKVQSLDSVKD